mmetsp:Transcript_7300/g.19139  ORF Transcript_7300/g.19139 Transcript_7300/m.19139 type:complete len:240 (+) Transcript_7300:1885-2604(+)
MPSPALLLPHWLLQFGGPSTGIVGVDGKVPGTIPTCRPRPWPKLGWTCFSRRRPCASVASAASLPLRSACTIGSARMSSSISYPCWSSARSACSCSPAAREASTRNEAHVTLAVHSERCTLVALSTSVAAPPLTSIVRPSSVSMSMCVLECTSMWLTWKTERTSVSSCAGEGCNTTTCTFVTLPVELTLTDELPLTMELPLPVAASEPVASITSSTTSRCFAAIQRSAPSVSVARTGAT